MKARIVPAPGFVTEPHDGPLLEVTDLRTWFRTPSGPVRAVDGVSLSVGQGRTLGIVGESGSGKTVLSRSIMGLLTAGSIERTGSIRYRGRELIDAPASELRHLWGTEMAMVFQDPMTSLNPVMRIGQQLTEGVRYHFDISKADAREAAIGLLTDVGIPDPKRRLRQYPHELSGGMRQRVTIAIALASGPSSSWPTSRPPPSTSRCRRRSSTCSNSSSATGSWRWCSSPTTSAWWRAARTRSSSCTRARSWSGPRPAPSSRR